MIAPFFISSGRSKADLLSAVTPETTTTQDTTQINTQVASAENAQTTPAATPKENLAVAPSDKSDASPVEWGERHDDLANSGSKGVAELRIRKSGWIPNAWVRDDIGGIALPYGKTDAEVKAENKGRKTGYGLAHIDEGHPDLDWDLADDAIRNGEIIERGKNRIVIQHDTGKKHRAVVQISFDGIAGNWLVTAYEKVEKAAESPANPSSDAHGDKGDATVTPENSASNTIPQSTEKSSAGSENALQKMRDAFENRAEILNSTSKAMLWTDIAREYADGKVLSKEADNAVLQEIIDMCLDDYQNSETDNILNAIAGNSLFNENIRKKAKSAIKAVENKRSDDAVRSTKQVSATISKITSAQAGSRDRIMAFTELPDGEHTVNGKSFTKSGNAFTLDGKTLNAREIEKATRTLSEKIKAKPEAEEKPSNQSDKSEKIEDFGEKIGGARKDIIRQYADKINLNGATFAKMFPKPDYAKLLEAGIKIDVLAKLKTAYDMAKKGAKIHKTLDGRQDLRVAKFYAVYAKNALIGEESVDMAEAGYVFTEHGKRTVTIRSQAMEQLLKELGVEYADVDLKGFDITDTWENGVKPEKPKWYGVQSEDWEKRYRVWAIYGKTGFFDKVEDAIKYFIELVKKHTTLDQPKYKLKMYKAISGEHSGEHYITAAIRGFGDVPLQYFKTYKEAYSYWHDHADDLQHQAAEMEEQKKAERKDKLTGKGKSLRLRFNTETLRDRVGVDYRNSKDISVKEFAEKFNFRAVEFGNSVSQKERQIALNALYDSLLDLAALLDISPKAISLNGKLAFAYGARGVGNAEAHYEPQKNVINLTKTRGAGNVAHEWWHALDFYFADSKNNPAMDGKYRDDIRPEIKKIFEELQKLFSGNSEYVTRAERLDAFTKKNYYTQPTEMAARAFADYVSRQLESQGQVNDFLSSHVLEADWEGEENTYPYPTGEDAVKIGNTFQSLFNTIDEKNDSSGNTVLFSLVGEKGAARMENAEILLDNLRIAREMTADGKDAKTIKLATGWEKGKDGKWRMEIPDLKWKTEATLPDGTEYKRTPFDMVHTSGKLSEYINAPELFQAYPELKNIKLDTKILPWEQYGYFDEERNQIVINHEKLAPIAESIDYIEDEKGKDARKRELIETIENILIHEVQHAIQQIEGFAKGGSLNADKKLSPESAHKARANSLRKHLADAGFEVSRDEAMILTDENANDTELEKLWDKLVDKGMTEEKYDKIFFKVPLFIGYNNLAGEVESRNAVTRSKLSMEERRQSLLDETADVAEEDRIYLMENAGVSELAVDTDGNQLFNVQGHGQMTITDIINDKNISAETEILTDSGNNIWGKITEEMAKAGQNFGLEALPIKLLKGNHGFGIVHIYKHLSDFPNQDLARLMELVFGDINKIYARDDAGNIKLEIFPPKARYYGILELRKQDGYYSVVSFFTRKSQHEKPKGKLIWVRSSQSATSQATNNQPKNEISEKMLQENQAELTAQTENNINPLQAEVNPASEKNPKISSISPITEEEITELQKDEDTASEIANNSKFSLVTDQKLIDKLDAEEEAGDYITLYRSVQIAPDGTLHSPMAGKINGKWGSEIVLCKWEQADERPELAILKKTQSGKLKFQFKLDKGNGKSIWAAYNPYLHSSSTMLNDQFSSAYTRPELVTIEVRVPKSELTSNYKAEKAKDHVGMMKWKAGVVQGKLSGKREVMLSRWDKPIRIVPDSEVAQHIKKLLDGKDITIPANVVTPSLRKELEKLGVKIDYSVKEYNADKEVNSGRVKFSISDIWTGSAADYDQPSLLYIGTGEGAQVYGWGLYGSESRKVAEWYADKDAAAKSTGIWHNGRDLYTAKETSKAEDWVLSAYDVLSDYDTKKITITEIKEYLQNKLQYLDEIKIGNEYTENKIKAIETALSTLDEYQIRHRADDLTGKRNLYRQTFFADKDHNLIDWGERVPKDLKDKILAQAEKENIFAVPEDERFDQQDADEVIRKLGNYPNYKGQILYQDLSHILGSPKAASEFLYRAGIDGITYIGDSSGVRNYVAFSDKDIRVDEHIKFSMAGDVEMEEIRAKYEGTDQWMKAPNGKPTNLTEFQWLQVRTKAFKEWFGDWENDPKNASRVVDKNGEPLVFSHFTGDLNDFYIFEQGHSNGIYHPRKGFYFVESNEAKEADLSEYFGNREIKVWLSVQKPLDLRNNDVWQEVQKIAGDSIEEKNLYDFISSGSAQTDSFIDAVIKKGYDGIILPDMMAGGTEFTSWIIFDPTQIKSATDNIGTFDPENPDIRYSFAYDFGDTSLSPIDYRRSIDPLFDFVMEYTDNGMVNPGQEHIGEDFTGSFISPEYKAYSIKRMQNPKESDSSYQRYLDRRQNALENADGTPLDELAAAYVRKFGGDEKDIAEKITKK